MPRLSLLLLGICLMGLCYGRRVKRSGDDEEGPLDMWKDLIKDNCPQLMPGAEEVEEEGEEEAVQPTKRTTRRRKRSGDGEDDEDDDSASSIKITSHLVRTVTIIAVFIVSMLFGLLPLKTLSLKYRSRIASIANCFGGGVFFGTCFMHLIPEVKMQITEYFEVIEFKEIAAAVSATFNNDTQEYYCDEAAGKIPTWITPLKKIPIPEMLECSGFLLILSVEKIAESAKKIRPLTQRFSVFISSSKLKTAQKLVKKQQDLEVSIMNCKLCIDMRPSRLRQMINRQIILLHKSTNKGAFSKKVTQKDRPQIENTNLMSTTTQQRD
eukprot:sb/3466779/